MPLAYLVAECRGYPAVPYAQHLEMDREFIAEPVERDRGAVAARGESAELNLEILAGQVLGGFIERNRDLDSHPVPPARAP